MTAGCVTTYRIRNWNQHFENNRTRDMKVMQWVAVPVKHDGEGFQTIMAQPDGIQIYGCWHLILQTAAKSHPRGTLLRDDGTPLTAHAIAMKTGWRHPDQIQRALDFCSSTEVGWIEALTKEPAGIPHPPAEIPQEGARYGMEGKGMEGDPPHPPLGVPPPSDPGKVEAPKEPKPEQPPEDPSPRFRKIPFTQWKREDFLDSIDAANHDGILTPTECKDFYGYWTEPNRAGRFKFQLQQTWDTRKRMFTAIRIVYQNRRDTPANGQRRTGIDSEKYSREADRPA